MASNTGTISFLTSDLPPSGGLRDCPPGRHGYHTLVLLRKWRRRARERSELINLTDRELWDFGVTRCEAMGEWRKPFWRQ